MHQHVYEEVAHLILEGHNMGMMYVINKILIYGLLVLCLIISGFGLFANKANAQYYYSNSSTNNASDYAHYRQLCPADFTLTVYNNNQYMCYKLFGGNVLGASVDVNPYNNFPSYNYNPVLPSPNLIPGCLTGYIYSISTGQRCDGNYYYNNGNINGGNGDIKNFEVRDGDDNTPQEGDNNAEVIEARFDVDNGDIRLDRVEFDFEFTGDSDGEDLPWNTFNEIRLLSDGTEIAWMNTDNKNDWDEESDDRYSFVFSGLDEMIRESDRGSLTLEVDINSSISGASNNNVSWDIFVPDDGLRARDGDNNVIYAGDDSDSASINIEEN